METDSKWQSNPELIFGPDDRDVLSWNFEIDFQLVEDACDIRLNDVARHKACRAISKFLIFTADGRPLRDAERRRIRSTYNELAKSFKDAVCALTTAGKILSDASPEVHGEAELSREYFKVPPVDLLAVALENLAERMHVVAERENEAVPRGRPRKTAWGILVNDLYAIYEAAGGRAQYTRIDSGYRDGGIAGPQYGGEAVAFIAAILGQVKNVFPERAIPSATHLEDAIGEVLRKRDK